MEISKLLLEALRGQQSWILSHQDRDGHNVLDSALLSSEYATRTVEWLRYLGARESDEVTKQLREEKYPKNADMRSVDRDEDVVVGNSEIMKFMLMRPNSRTNIETNTASKKETKEDRIVRPEEGEEDTASKSKPSSPRRMTLTYVSKDTHSKQNSKA